MNKIKWLLILLLMAGGIYFVFGHSGRLDEKGGHTDGRTGIYHHHGKRPDIDIVYSEVADGCDDTVKLEPVISFSNYNVYKVDRVVDGDTVKIMYEGKSTSVRLVGIDTPETVRPNTKPQPYGKEASTFTKNLLTGECVYFVPDDMTAEKDKYGRLLGHLYRYPDKLFINAELVRQGYARAYTKYPFQHSIWFVKLEKFAKSNRRGLWGL